MRTIILFAMLSGVVCLSCTNKRQRFLPEATLDKDRVIIGGSDTVTGSKVMDRVSPDSDFLFYNTPAYTQDTANE